MDGSGTSWFGTIKDRVNWSSVKRFLSVLFFAVVAYLVIDRATAIEWAEVFSTLRATPLSTLLTALLFSFLCYAAYSCYDLLGRYALNHRTKAFSVALAAWISYACNMNLGAIVGSVAFRYRLYSRLGVGAADVTRIISISVLTNWVGYILLAGALFISGAIEPPKSWVIGQGAMQWLGAAFLLVVVTYIFACAFYPKRELHIRSQIITLPTLRFAMLQFVMATIHWTLMALVIYQFFSEQLAFSTVYAVLLVSAVAGAMAHIPGGIGVLEAVFIALLAGELPSHQILAGVFAYRIVFYLVPLAVSLLMYIAYEAYFRARPWQPARES